MRPLIALALVLAACGQADRAPAAHESPSASSSRGPDLLVMRLPRGGGVLRILAYPKLDSVVWSASDPAPPISRVLAFDEEAGLLSFVDAKGVPARGRRITRRSGPRELLAEEVSCAAGARSA